LRREREKFERERERERRKRVFARKRKRDSVWKERKKSECFNFVVLYVWLMLALSCFALREYIWYYWKMELVDKTDKLTQRKIDKQIYREEKTIWIRQERDCNKKNEK
jgi:hypothetical protein